MLPELVPGHVARADAASYFKQRDSWPCCQGIAAFLQSPQVLQLMQAALGSTAVLLYNEQYIMKPPHSSGSAFGWHYDSQWCDKQHGVQYSPYLSLWVALDDMTAENGCLVVLPGSRGNKQTGNSGCSSRMEACELAGQAVPQSQQAPDVQQVQFIEMDSLEVLLAKLSRICSQAGADPAADAAATSADASSDGGLQDRASSSCHLSCPGHTKGCAVGLEVPAGTAVSYQILDHDIVHVCTAKIRLQLLKCSKVVTPWATLHLYLRNAGHCQALCGGSNSTIGLLMCSLSPAQTCLQFAVPP